jgi:hypothetical protein
VQEDASFDELSQEAATVALEGFVPFYVARFKNDDLEIIAALADDRLVAEVNHVLAENRRGTIDQDTAISLKMSRASYQGILRALDMTYDQAGFPKKPWAQWYAEHHAKLIKEN